jgi:hypothetical protein
MGRVSPRGDVVAPLDGVRHGPRFVGYDAVLVVYTRDSGSLCSANYTWGVGTGWAGPLGYLGHSLQLCMSSTKGAHPSLPARLARRVGPGGGVTTLDEFAAFEERKRARLRTRMAMPYQLQKCATWRHFQRFLRQLPGQPT